MIDDHTVCLREGKKRETELDRHLKRLEDDLVDRDTLVEDLRVEILRIKGEYDQERAHSHTLDRSKNDLNAQYE
jgi:hypothetical protein